MERITENQLAYCTWPALGFLVEAEAAAVLVDVLLLSPLLLLLPLPLLLPLLLLLPLCSPLRQQRFLSSPQRS